MNVKSRYTNEVLGEFNIVPNAYLRDADLRDADLRDANLRGANLKGADLRGADLRNADLGDADLRDANLRGANLGGADLRGADLRNADLRDANLGGADLGYANLGGANLGGANLVCANLRGANLGKADLNNIQVNNYTEGYFLACPETGSFDGFKSCLNNTIVKLLIPAKAKRSSATTRKCRAEYVKVVRVYGTKKAISKYDETTIYEKGKIVRCHKWDENRWDECSGGIHFFLTKEEAELWS